MTCYTFLIHNCDIVCLFNFSDIYVFVVLLYYNYIYVFLCIYHLNASVCQSVCNYDMIRVVLVISTTFSLKWWAKHVNCIQASPKFQIDDISSVINVFKLVALLSAIYYWNYQKIMNALKVHQLAFWMFQFTLKENSLIDSNYPHLSL